MSLFCFQSWILIFTYIHCLKITLQELYLDRFHKGYSWVSNIACGQSKVNERAGCHVSALHQCSVPKTSDCMHMWTGTNHKSLQDRPGKLRSETSAVDSITFETDHDTAVNLRVSIWFWYNEFVWYTAYLWEKKHIFYSSFLKLVNDYEIH